jgi:hypothetical protein
MDGRTQRAFGILIAAQAAHSLEEYAGHLYDVFGPARSLSGLVAENRALGFAVLNAGVVAFGLWCYVAQVRKGRRYARLLAWLWVAVELVNGFGHAALAMVRGGYFPGVATAPVLAAVSLYLARRLALGDRAVRC